MWSTQFACVAAAVTEPYTLGTASAKVSVVDAPRKYPVLVAAATSLKLSQMPPVETQLRAWNVTALRFAVATSIPPPAAFLVEVETTRVAVAPHVSVVAVLEAYCLGLLDAWGNSAPKVLVAYHRKATAAETTRDVSTDIFIIFEFIIL